jgi:TRAP-type C4-dicarboxylate transport system substrate-binding protein
MIKLSKLAAAVGACLLMGSVATATHAQEVKKWALIGDLSYRPHFKEIETPFWLEGVAEAAGGKLDIQLRGWDTLGLKGPEVWHFIQQGTFTGGSTSLSRNAGELAMNEGLDLAGLAPTQEDLRKLLDAAYPMFAKYYEEEHQLKVLGFYSAPPQLIMCRREITGLESLKGLKVRVSGASQAKLMEELEATPVNIAFAEVQTALQTGVVDCGITATLAAFNQGWHEAAQYIYPLAVNWQPNTILLNMDAWNDLGTEVQDKIMALLPDFYEKSWEQNLKEANGGLACMTGDPQYGECPGSNEIGNMKVVDLVESDRELITEAVKAAVIPLWAKRCGAECVELWNGSVGKALGITASAE